MKTRRFIDCIKAVGSIAVLFTAAGAGPAWAATLVVTNTSDSGAGSLRQAILSANSTANVSDVIHFSIPGDGPHTISPITPLPVVTDPVVIDGYSQSGASSNTLVAGNSAVLKIVVLESLVIDTTNSTVRGLAIRQIQIGSTPNSKGGNVVEGCFVGLDATGTNSLASPGFGVFVQTPANRVGGTNPGARNLISGKGATGIEVFESFATNNVIQGNYIGTDRTGTKAIPNTDRALVVNMNASVTTIGGSVPGAGNLISGNLDRGITLDGSFNLVQGNFIGTDVTGLLPLGNARTGIEIGGVGNTVGGSNIGAGNIIAFNGVGGDGFVTTNGVDVKVGTTLHAILGNSIFDNMGLGIDVNADKLITAGYPVLTVASNTGSATVIKGTHTPNISFLLELFTNLTPDPSGYGEGRTRLVGDNVSTDAGGNFTINWPTPIAPGLFLTATANGNTEFSQARMVTAAVGTNSWTNSVGGKWETGANWSLNVPPFAGHSLVLITNAATKTVISDATTASAFPSTLTISNLVIGAPGGATNTLVLAHGDPARMRILTALTLNSGGALVISNAALNLEGKSPNASRIDGALTLQEGSLTVTNGTQFYIGNNGSGTLTVSNGTFRAYYPIVGINPGANGTWNIAGGTNIVTTVFDIADSLTATGTVRMTGGQLSTPSIYIGLFGNGSMLVSNGNFQCASQGLVASQPGAQGNFTATGGTSTFGSMLIGESSTATGAVLVAGSALVQVNGELDNRGTLTVAGGSLNVLGQLESIATRNAISVTGGEFAVTNDNSFLTRVSVSNGAFLARDVFLGNGAFGSLDVAGSGQVALRGSFNGLIVGGNGGTGVVSQAGGEILLPDTDLSIGGLFSPAVGRMTISNGTTRARYVYVGGQGGGNGTVTMAGGTLIASNLAVNPSSQFIFSAGTLKTRSSAVVNTAPFVVGDGTSPAVYQLLGGTNSFARGLRIASNAMLAGTGTIACGVTNAAGSILSPGASIGTLTINSNLLLAGTTYMELNKLGVTNDRVHVLTSVSYGGTLVVTNLAGTLIPGDTFTLFGAAAASGNFGGIVNQTGNSGIGFTFNPTNGVLSVVSGTASYPTNITFSRSGSTLSLSWPETHKGWILQSQTNALNVGIQTNASAWFDWLQTAFVTATNLPIVPTNPTVFFRLRHP